MSTVYGDSGTLIINGHTKVEIAVSSWQFYSSTNTVKVDGTMIKLLEDELMAGKCYICGGTLKSEESSRGFCTSCAARSRIPVPAGEKKEEPTKMADRRMKLMRIPHSMLLQLLNLCNTRPSAVYVLEGIPMGSLITQIRHEPSVDTFVAHVYHESFDIVPEGQILPELMVKCREVEIK